VEATTGFVLAGGGFKGAFELGALRYLVDDLGITPDVIASASAGSILGMVLAQGRTAAEFGRQLENAQETLLAMTEADQVFGRQEWLGEFEGTDFAERVVASVMDRSSPEVPGGDPDPDRTPGIGEDDDRRGHGDGDDDVEEPHGRPWSELTKLRDQLRAAARARRTLTGTTSSVLTLDPFERAVRGDVDVGIPAVEPALVARPGLQLRMAVTAVKARETHYVCQDGTIVGPDAVTPLHDGATPVGLIDGAIASSSVPMVFPARRLGKDTYVDGGCLQNIPLTAAVALGATRIFTVVAIPLRDADDDRPSRPMWAARELGFLETQEANLAIPLPEGTTNTVITPTLDVVGSFEVHRGLMRIDIDYGWMRAQETLADADDGLRPIVTAATDTITVQRTRAWHLERQSMEQGGLTPTRLVALRQIKTAVRSAVLARTALGFAAPPGAERWWAGYETHSLPVPDSFPDDPGPREPGSAEAADDPAGASRDR
jgi:predicted acylesterase/phospholipase RssA